MNSTKEDMLRVNLSPSRPVELADFIKSCSALMNEYNSFIETKEPKQGKLFIKEVRKGSIEIDLVPSLAGVVAVTQTVMPFLESTNIIGDFVSHLRAVFDWLKEGGFDANNRYSADTIKNSGEILAPIVKDEKSSMSFSPVINVRGDVNAPIYISNNDSRLIQQTSDRLLNEMNTPNLERKEDVILKWSQVRNNTNIKDKRYKSIIQSISGKEVSTVFADKSQMAIFQEDKSFFKCLWLVTVLVERIDGIPKLYKIEKIERLDDDD